MKFFRWILSLFRAPAPKQQLAPKASGLTRRQFFQAIGAAAVVTAVSVSKLDTLLPLQDSWRYGWIWLPGKHPVYYGIDMERPIDLRIWLAGNEISFHALRAMPEYEEACAEIDISQGHAGLRWYAKHPDEFM